MSFAELAAQLAEIGRQCYARGWALGTSGNFSAVVLVNNWLCAAEEGEGFIELTTMTNLGDWQITPAAATPVTESTLAAAFTEWERRFREEPERFASDAARLAMGAESYGEACAPYLLEILAEQAGTAATA